MRSVYILDALCLLQVPHFRPSTGTACVPAACCATLTVAFAPAPGFDALFPSLSVPFQAFVRTTSSATYGELDGCYPMDYSSHRLQRSVLITTLAETLVIGEFCDVFMSLF